MLPRTANILPSGVTRPSTPLPPALSFPLATFTTFAILGTATPPSNIAPPTPRWADSFPVSPSSRRRRPTTRRDSRKTTTGSTGTRPRRTVWAAAAAAIPTLSTSKAKKVAVWRSGSKSQAVGPAHESFERRRGATKACAHLGSGFTTQMEMTGREGVVEGLRESLCVTFHVEIVLFF